MTKIVGIDFDNTIANYSSSFYQIGRELDWIPKNIEPTKNAVKHFLQDHVNPEKWTELQGIVYGKHIALAHPYDGVKQAITLLLEKGVTLYIVSHKTLYPVIGEKVSLHDAALNWLINREIVGEGSKQIAKDKVFFNLTQQEKVERISQLGCDYFIDDLPAIFQRSDFPSATKKILFDPLSQSKNELFFDDRLTAWSEIEQVVNASS